MILSLKITPSDLPEEEVRDAVDYALRAEAEQARVRRDYLQRACLDFEAAHHMSSDEFMARFEAGELGDEVEYLDWYAAKRGLDLWQHRYDVLGQVAW